MLRILLAALFALLPAAAFAQAPAAPAARFSVIVEGSGPDVILIPGLSTPRDVWDGVRPALRARYRLHLIQLRGFGEPAGPNATGPVLEPFVAALAAYIADNRLARPAVIGHGLGGLGALLLGARRPDLPGRIMVVDALPFIGAMAGPEATVESVTPLAEQIRDGLVEQAATTPPEFDRPAPDCAAPDADPGENQQAERLSGRPAGRCLVAHWVRRSDLRVVGQARYDAFVTDLRPALARIAAPVTLVYPQDDGAMPAGEAEALYRGAYAGAARLTLVAVPDSQHFIMLDQPERFRAALEAFLAGR
ncbi:MAG TPA: alpha/beta hydrolase [Allosphingosinicella sp.]|nr:alpha/beta hydrolase [Allosphingosinicella sp.]